VWDFRTKQGTVKKNLFAVRTGLITIHFNKGTPNKKPA